MFYALLLTNSFQTTPTNRKRGANLPEVREKEVNGWFLGDFFINLIRMGTINKLPKAFKELHEILSDHSDNPREHLEAIANEAFRDECLIDMQYDVLKHRFPFLHNVL